MKHTILTLTIASLLATTAFADAIHDAAKAGDSAGVQAQLDAGADVNAEGDHPAGLTKWTPLHYAASEGHKEVVELLIANGADLVARDSASCTPLLRAAENGHTEVAELLIAAGADVNVKGVMDYTPLRLTANYGYKETSELLIAKGADVNAVSVEGETPLDRAETELSWQGAQTKATKKEIADLLRTHGGKTGEELEAWDDLQAQLDAANVAKAELQAQLEASETTVNELTASGADLQTQLDKATAANADLQAQLDAANVAKADLQAQLEASGGSAYGTQVLNLKAGWNLSSFYVETDDMSPQIMLTSISDQLLMIKNLRNSYNPNQPAHLNTLAKLRLGEGYWIKVTEDLTLTIQN